MIDVPRSAAAIYPGTLVTSVYYNHGRLVAHDGLGIIVAVKNMYDDAERRLWSSGWIYTVLWTVKPNRFRIDPLLMQNIFHYEIIAL